MSGVQQQVGEGGEFFLMVAISIRVGVVRFSWMLTDAMVKFMFLSGIGHIFVDGAFVDLS